MPRILLQASTSLSMLQAAFAGLVDGRHMHSLPVTGSVYFLYIFSAVLPLTYISDIGAASRISLRSFAVTSLMLASDDPVIRHEAMTSHAAI